MATTLPGDTTPAPGGPLILADPRIQALAAGDEADRRSAADRLVEIGPPAVIALLAAMDDANLDLAKMAEQVLFRMVQRPLDEARRRELCDLLVGQLAEPHASSTRRYICRLLSYIADEQAVGDLYRYLGEPEVQEMVRWVMLRSPGMNSTQAMVAALQITEWDFRQTLIAALGQAADRRAIPILRIMLRSDDPGMQQLALQALARIGDPAAAAVIEQALQSGIPQALDALLRQGEALIDRGLNKEAVDIFRAIASRDGLTAMQVCRLAHGLGRVGGPADADWLIDRLKEAQRWGRQANRVQLACMAGLQTLAGPALGERLTAAYDQAESEGKKALLQAMRRVTAPAVVDLLIRASQSPQEELRREAILALRENDSPAAERQLAALAESESAELAGLALGSYLELAARREASDPQAAAERYVKAYALARDPEQTSAALDGIARTAGAEYLDLLDTLLPMMVEEQVPPAVCRAAAALAMKMPPEQHQDASQILQLAASLIPGDPIVDRIAAFLSQAGESLNLAGPAGFLTRWLLAGPFPLSDPQTWNREDFSPEQVDFNRPLTIGGISRPWLPHHSEHPRGTVVLDGPLGVEKQVYAYAVMVFSVDEPREAHLKLGSDDSVVVWLNGRKVHEHQIHRGVRADEDQVAVQLRQGENILVIKIINGSAGWGFCARLTTPGGMPLHVEVLQP